MGPFFRLERQALVCGGEIRSDGKGGRGGMTLDATLKKEEFEGYLLSIVNGNVFV